MRILILLSLIGFLFHSCQQNGKGQTTLAASQGGVVEKQITPPPAQEDSPAKPRYYRITSALTDPKTPDEIKNSQD
ncbi:MAG: hypothetical protein ACTTIC_08650 [Helicobacteraceae bacterium]